MTEDDERLDGDREDGGKEEPRRDGEGEEREHRRRRRRGRPRRAERERKDRLLQTRVPEDLETTLKSEAKRRRLSLSHLIRNVLEDSFQLVDNVVGEVDDIVESSVSLAHKVSRDARRVAKSAHRAGEAYAEDSERRGRRRAHPTDRGGERGDDGAEGAVEPPERRTDTRGAPEIVTILAWNQVVMNVVAQCTRCSVDLQRGELGFLGIAAGPTPAPVWLCNGCREAL